MARVGSNLAMGHPHGISQEMPWELRASRLPEWNVHQRHFPLSREHGHWMNIDEYRHLSIFPILSYPVLSFPILSYPILSYLSIYLSVLSIYLILSYLILSYLSIYLTHFYSFFVGCIQIWCVADIGTGLFFDDPPQWMVP